MGNLLLKNKLPTDLWTMAYVHRAVRVNRPEVWGLFFAPRALVTTQNESILDLFQMSGLLSTPIFRKIINSISI